MTQPKPRDLLNDRALVEQREAVDEVHRRAVLREQNAQRKAQGLPPLPDKSQVGYKPIIASVPSDRNAVKTPQDALNDKRRAAFTSRWLKQKDPLLQLWEVS